MEKEMERKLATAHPDLAHFNILHVYVNILHVYGGLLMRSEAQPREQWEG